MGVVMDGAPYIQHIGTLRIVQQIGAQHGAVHDQAPAAATPPLSSICAAIAIPPMSLIPKRTGPGEWFAWRPPEEAERENNVNNFANSEKKQSM